MSASTRLFLVTHRMNSRTVPVSLMEVEPWEVVSGEQHADSTNQYVQVVGFDNRNE